MTIHYQGHGVTLHHGDCLDVLRTLPDASVDSVCTDPPYGLEFMGKEWDKFAAPSKGRADLVEHSNFTAKKSKFKDGVGTQVGMPKKNPRCRACSRLKFDKPASKCACGAPDWDTRTREYAQDFQQWCEAWAAECLRVLKPGGHLLAFGGTRTWHRLACAVEDAGFEVRDSIAWLYGSGFPKSLDVSKAIDKADGHWRGRAGEVESDNGSMGGPNYARTPKGDPVTAAAAAAAWAGWGTALKPAFEPVVVARKPLAGTVAATVLAHGTGALNIDGCRVEGGGNLQRPERRGKGDTGGWADYSQEPGQYGTPDGQGRWPANVILDESQAEVLDQMSGESASRPAEGVKRHGRSGGIMGAEGALRDGRPEGHADSGGASRFFYVAREDNESGTMPNSAPGVPLDELAERFRYVAKAPTDERPRVNGTAHPTVKPLSLMRWLVRLVTPPGGTVLEPFAGSGTTVEACIVEGFQCIAIEREADYLPLIRQRIDRRRDPVEALRGQAADLGLFDLLGGEGA